jgi:hypothetical protein
MGLVARLAWFKQTPWRRALAVVSAIVASIATTTTILANFHTLGWPLTRLFTPEVADSVGIPAHDSLQEVARNPSISALVPAVSPDSGHEPRIVRGDTSADPEPRDMLERYAIRVKKGAPGERQWGVLIALSDSDYSSLVNTASAALRPKGIRLVRPLRGSVIRDGLHERLYEGEPALIASLGLTACCDGLILGKGVWRVAEDDVVARVTTARLSVTVRLLKIPAGELEAEFGLETRGGGFSQDRARKQAVERLAAALADTLSIALR